MTGVEILAGGSAVLGALGVLAGGMQAASAAEFNAAQADRQAELFQRQAAFDEDRQRQAGQRYLAGMRSAAGASNLALEGSPLRVMEESAADIELDALAIRYGGEVSAQGARSQAAFDRSRAGSTRIGAGIGAGAQLFAGAGRAFTRLGSSGGTT